MSGETREAKMKDKVRIRNFTLQSKPRALLSQMYLAVGVGNKLKGGISDVTILPCRVHDDKFPALRHTLKGRLSFMVSMMRLFNWNAHLFQSATDLFKRGAIFGCVFHLPCLIYFSAQHFRRNVKHEN